MKNILTAAIVALVAVSLARCNNPTTDKPRAEVKAPIREASASTEEEADAYRFQHHSDLHPRFQT